MEGALLEWQEDGIAGIAPRALGEHVDTLTMALDLRGGAGHGLTRIKWVGAIYEDGAGETHEPAEERNLEKRALRRHRAPLGKDAGEHQYVKLRLVVTDEYGWPCLIQVVLRIIDDKGQACRVPHKMLKAARDEPLRDARVTDNVKAGGGNHTGRGAY